MRKEDSRNKNRLRISPINIGRMPFDLWLEKKKPEVQNVLLLGFLFFMTEFQ